MKDSENKNIVIRNILIIILATLLLIGIGYFAFAKFTNSTNGIVSFITGKQILETRGRSL